VADRVKHRVVYFGTPAYAVPALRALAASPNFDVELVVTQPDRPSGRGHRTQAPPVKEVAVELGLPVHQPESLRSAAARAPFAELHAEVFVVAAYGHIFGPKTLALPRLGCVNLHASLLPRYRGASPVAAAILSGDAQTGVTLMRMDRGMDTGDVIATRALGIREADTTQTLTERLGELGASIVAEELVRYLAGQIHASPQSTEGASVVRPLTKADGRIDWRLDARAVERHVRAMWEWPRAWTTARGDVLQVHGATVQDGLPMAEPGTVLVGHGDLVVACGNGALRLDVVQAPGGRPQPGAAFLAGRRWESGVRLGDGVESPPTPSPIIRRLTET
jgi:methionyl-tRNA formyltransferase